MEVEKTIEAEPWQAETSELPPVRENRNPGSRRPNRPSFLNSRLEGALHGDQDPAFIIQHEKPIHRLMTTMAAKGFTSKEIAEYTGYTDDMVCQVLRQPWARENMIGDVRKSVSDELKEFLESSVMPVIREIKAIAMNPEVQPQVRVAAGKEVLDRFLGKPNQPITTSTNEPSKLTNEELERRVSSLVAGVPTPPGNS